MHDDEETPMIATQESVPSYNILYPDHRYLYPPDAAEPFSDPASDRLYTYWGILHPDKKTTTRIALMTQVLLDKLHRDSIFATQLRNYMTQTATDRDAMTKIRSKLIECVQSNDQIFTQEYVNEMFDTNGNIHSDKSLDDIVTWFTCLYRIPDLVLDGKLSSPFVLQIEPSEIQYAAITIFAFSLNWGTALIHQYKKQPDSCWSALCCFHANDTKLDMASRWFERMLARENNALGLSTPRSPHVLRLGVNLISKIEKTVTWT